MARSFTKGFIPFGTAVGTDGVLFSDTLTDQAALDAKTGTTITTMDFSSAGVKATAASSSILIDLSAVAPDDYAKLAMAGQLHLEVEPLVFTAANQVLIGTDNDSTHWSNLITISATSGLCRFGTLDQAYGNAWYYTANERSSLHSDGYIHIDMFWEGGTKEGTVSIAINGLFDTHYTAGAVTQNYTRVDARAMASNFFKRMRIGSDRGIQYGATGQRVRNFHISYKPPVFSTHPLLSRVGIFGDSQVDCTPNISTGNSSERTFLKQYFYSKGRKLVGIPGAYNSATLAGPGYEVAHRHGGTTLQDQYNHHIAASGAQYGKLKIFIEQRPSVAILRFGNNDVSVTSGTPVVADWPTYYTDVMQATANYLINTENIPAIVWCTCPPIDMQTVDSDVAAEMVNVATYNTYVAALPAWWDATYPSKAGRLVVADVFTALGGTYSAEYFTYGDIHMIAAGKKVQAICMAEALEVLMRRFPF